MRQMKPVPKRKGEIEMDFLDKLGKKASEAY